MRDAAQSETLGTNTVVAGLDVFPESRWREAIMHFLFGIWGRKDWALFRPEIMMGNVILQRDQATGHYRAFQTARSEAQWLGQVELEDFLYKLDTFVAFSREPIPAHEVEVALARFVKDDQIGILHLFFDARYDEVDGQSLQIWKFPQRSRYGIQGFSLPMVPRRKAA